MSSRGPRLHCVRTRDDRSYPSSREEPSTQPWQCSCGDTGSNQATAERHLALKAKAAFARLDNSRAFVVAAVTASRLDMAAFSLLGVSQPWYGHPALRKRMTPMYDWAGCLCAVVDWPAVAADLDAGTITGDESDLLVLRIAASLAGVSVRLQLSGLWHLHDDAARHVRNVLLKQLRLDGEG